MLPSPLSRSLGCGPLSTFPHSDSSVACCWDISAIPEGPLLGQRPSFSEVYMGSTARMLSQTLSDRLPVGSPGTLSHMVPRDCSTGCGVSWVKATSSPSSADTQVQRACNCHQCLASLSKAFRRLQSQFKPQSPSSCIICQAHRYTRFSLLTTYLTVATEGSKGLLWLTV